MAHTSNIAPNSSSKSDNRQTTTPGQVPQSTSVVKVASLKKRLRREKNTASMQCVIYSYGTIGIIPMVFWTEKIIPMVLGSYGFSPADRPAKTFGDF